MGGILQWTEDWTLPSCPFRLKGHHFRCYDHAVCGWRSGAYTRAPTALVVSGAPVGTLNTQSSFTTETKTKTTLEPPTLNRLVPLQVLDADGGGVQGLLDDGRLHSNQVLRQHGAPHQSEVSPPDRQHLPRAQRSTRATQAAANSEVLTRRSEARKGPRGPRSRAGRQTLTGGELGKSHSDSEGNFSTPRRRTQKKSPCLKTGALSGLQEQSLAKGPRGTFKEGVPVYRRARESSPSNEGNPPSVSLRMTQHRPPPPPNLSLAMLLLYATQKKNFSGIRGDLHLYVEFEPR